MIRPLTCVCMLLAAGSGLYLYQTKHRSQLLDREIQRTMKQTDAVRDRIGVLKSEWAFLGEPERLSELTRQHLSLRPMAPTQVVAMADLAAKLPPPAAPGSLVPRPDGPEELPAIAAGKPSVPGQPTSAEPPVQVAGQAAGAPGAKPVQVAATAPAKPARPAPRMAEAAAHPAEPPARSSEPPVALASAAPAPAPSRIQRPSAPVVAVASAPIGGHVPGNLIGESVARVSRGLPPLSYAPSAQLAAMPVAARPIAAPAYRAPAYSPPAFANPAPVGSALGGARAALPAPVPFNGGG